MVILLIIILAISASLGGVRIKEDAIIGIANLIIALLTIACICVWSDSIKPIDVYRNKTTLEITYRDSIPIDSVVVKKY